MTETKEPRGIAGWIENHLWAILAAAIAAYSGYLTGMTTMGARIDALESQARDMRAILVGQRRFGNDAADRLEYLCGENPKCWERYGKMERPE